MRMVTASVNVNTIQNKLEQIVHREGGSHPSEQRPTQSDKFFQSDEVHENGESEPFTTLTWLGGSEKKSTKLKFVELCQEEKQEESEESPEGPLIPISRMDELLEWILRLSDDVMRTDQVINVFKNIATRALVLIM